MACGCSTRSAATIVATNSSRTFRARSRSDAGSWPRLAMSGTERLRRILLVLMACLAAGGLAAAYGKAGQMSRDNSAKLAGAFVDWGTVGREHTLQQWEGWLNQKPS